MVSQGIPSPWLEFESPASEQGHVGGKVLRAHVLDLPEQTAPFGHTWHSKTFADKFTM